MQSNYLANKCNGVKHIDLPPLNVMKHNYKVAQHVNTKEQVPQHAVLTCN